MNGRWRCRWCHGRGGNPPALGGSHAHWAGGSPRFGGSGAQGRVRLGQDGPRPRRLRQEVDWGGGPRAAPALNACGCHEVTVGAAEDTAVITAVTGGEPVGDGSRFCTTRRWWAGRRRSSGPLLTPPCRDRAAQWSLESGRPSVEPARHHQLPACAATGSSSFGSTHDTRS